MVTPLTKRVLFCITCGFFLIIDCNVAVRNGDICGVHNGRRLYLELGDKGILYAKNVSYIENLQRQSSRMYTTNSSYNQCSLELVTCPSCAISVIFQNLALAYSCSDNGILMDSPCRCDYVWISEPPYEEISGTPYCGFYSPVTYRSSTRTVSIIFFYSKSHEHAFTLEYTSERNKVHLKGLDSLTPKRFNGTVGGLLTSPFFPARYPRDLGVEYIITCPIEASSCRIRVLFSDFQLATVSIIEFYDWNGQRLDISSGARFRPPIIVSSGPSLLIRFYANGGTGLGYKAFYSYILGNKYDKTIQPITDCGGYVENLGGTITMMDMVIQGLKIYDCVWLIRPPKNFLHTNTHIYLRVVTFSNMGNTELTIRQGPTSALIPLEVIKHPTNLPALRMREHVAPITSGFHVSLRGVFGVNSRVAIAYAAFGYMDCFSGSDFLCQNHRCIQSQLNCDGFDHCGDNSDEPTSCFRDWNIELRNRKWHTNKANYYFPKIDRYPDLKTATLVFVASSLGLIILISALIVLLYRMGARSRQQRELHSRLQTISELLDRTVFDIADGGRIDEITVHDEPPIYEAPPGYDEVIKVELENEEFQRKKKKISQQSQELRHHIPLNRELNLEAVSTHVTDFGTIVPQSPPPPYIIPSESVIHNLGEKLCRHNTTHVSLPISTRHNHIRQAWKQPIKYRHSFPCSGEPNIIYMNAPQSVKAFSTCLQHFEPITNTSIDNFDVNSRSLCKENNMIGCTCQGACGCISDIQNLKSEPEEYYPEQTVLGVFEKEESSLQNRNTTLSVASCINILASKNSKQSRITSTYSRKINMSHKTFISPCFNPDRVDIVSIPSMSDKTPNNINCSSDVPNFALNQSPKEVVDIVENKNVETDQQSDKSKDSFEKNDHKTFETLDDIFVNRSTNQYQFKNMSAMILFSGAWTCPRQESYRIKRTKYFQCVRRWKSNDETLLN